MKSTEVSYRGVLEKQSCCRLMNTKYLALLSGIYTLNISILVILMFGWQINANYKRYQDLGEVYYGIQISQVSIIATQCATAILSVVLIVGIHTENASLVVPWIIGGLTFVSLETVAMVYCNVLRDHIFKFDEVSKGLLGFFIARAIVNALAMWSVIRYHHLLRSGVSWKINKNIVEL